LVYENENNYAFLRFWDFFTIGYLEPTDQETKMALTNAERILLKEKINKDNKALDLIQQGLIEIILPKVSNVVS
jgi:hypothetical protein